MSYRLRRVFSRCLLVCSAAAALNACGSTGGTSPSSSGSATPTPTPTSSGPTPTPQLIGTMRTVLSPLGLFMHSDPTLSAQNRIANLQQGVTVTVLDYQAGNGGWFKVMGQSLSGWIVADPTLTAGGTFNVYPQGDRGFGALYPANWTFQQEANDVLFVPTQGSQSIVVRTAASTSAFAGITGYTSVHTEDVIPCGYTGSLVQYMRTGSPPAAASPGGVPAPNLAMYADIRLRFDSMHAMLIAFNYQSQDQFAVFQNFYNSIRFPYSQCEATATPSPT